MPGVARGPSAESNARARAHAGELRVAAAVVDGACKVVGALLAEFAPTLRVSVEQALA